MNNKVKENLSFFQVRKGINDTIWLSRQADIINNHICASDNDQYSNSYQFKNNDGYPNGFIGVWRWSIQPEKYRSRTYTFIPEITGGFDFLYVDKSIPLTVTKTFSSFNP